MKIDRKKLFRLSRDPRFLIRVAVAIAVVSIFAGLVVSLTSTRAGVIPLPGSVDLEESGDGEHWSQLEKHLDLSELDTARAAELIRAPDDISGGYFWLLEEFASPESENDSALYQSPFVSFLENKVAEAETIDPSERKLLLDLSYGLHGQKEKAAAALEGLKSAAAMEPPRRYASEFLADVLSKRREIDSALDAYRLEVFRFEKEADYSRVQILKLLKQENRTDELRQLFNVPEYRQALPVLDQIEIATILRDYLGLLRAVIAHDFDFGSFGLFTLSLIAGAIWLVIVTQFSGYGRKRFVYYLVALILGWFSASGTLFVVQIQEEIQGFQYHSQGTFASQLIYCIAGIGLREETLKLLFFIPLALVLLKSRRGEIDALVCAGLVGLGFAINENSGYVFDQASAFSAWSRFMTANFLHIAMTGVIGLAFYRMCRWPRRQWDQFLYDFLIIVAIHGVYDGLMIIPSLASYAALWLVVFAVTAYLFLDQASKLMGTGASHLVSPLGVFVVGSATLLGVIFLYACWGVPFLHALSDYIGTLAELLPIAFVFINRFRLR